MFSDMGSIGMIGTASYARCVGGMRGCVDVWHPSSFKIILPRFQVDRRSCCATRYALFSSYNLLQSLISFIRNFGVRLGIPRFVLKHLRRVASSLAVWDFPS